MGRNTRRLSLKGSRPDGVYTLPYEYWSRCGQTPPLRDKAYFIIDEIFGAMTARYTKSGEWKAMHGIDPENVTHCVGFEYPR